MWAVMAPICRRVPLGARGSALPTCRCKNAFCFSYPQGVEHGHARSVAVWELHVKSYEMPVYKYYLVTQVPHTTHPNTAEKCLASRQLNCTTGAVAEARHNSHARQPRVPWLV